MIRKCELLKKLDTIGGHKTKSLSAFMAQRCKPQKIESLRTFWATNDSELLRQSDTIGQPSQAKLLKLAKLQENLSCAETLPKM